MDVLTAELLGTPLPGSRVQRSAPSFTEPENVCSVSRTTTPDGGRRDILEDRSQNRALRLAGNIQMTTGSRGSRTNLCLEGFPWDKKSENKTDVGLIKADQLLPVCQP